MVLLASSLPALAATDTFNNTTPIPLSGDAPSSLYPSTIDVSGLVDPVTDVNVTLHQFSHGSPDFVWALLVGPEGQAVLLMGDNGDDPITDITLTFDDEAAAPLPEYPDNLTSGTFRPNPWACFFDDDSSLPSPAPAAPYQTELSAFDGSDANGTWSLYVASCWFAYDGTISGGWSLEITTERETTPPVLEIASITSGGDPYTPGTWTNQPVSVTFTCTDETALATGIEPSVTTTISTPARHAKTRPATSPWRRP
jgi:hypothetical protein